MPHRNGPAPVPLETLTNRSAEPAEPQRRPLLRRRFILLILFGIASLVTGSLVLLRPGGEEPRPHTEGAPSSESYTVPAAIASDCSRDVSGELTRFLESVPNATAPHVNTVIFSEGGCYLVSEAVRLENREGLVLVGQNARLRRDEAPPSDSNRRRKAILFVGSSRRITVRDLTIVGDNDQPDNKDPGNYYDFDVDREHEHALLIYGDDKRGGPSSEILVSNLKTDQVFGDSIRLWGVHDVRIEKSTIYGAGRQGIAARGTDRLAIVDNVFDYLRRTAIDFEEDPVTNVRIEGNHFESHNFNLGNFSGALGPDKNILIENNTANPDVRKSVRCTEETTGVVLRDNQPEFTDKPIGGNTNGCPSDGFDESRLPR